MRHTDGPDRILARSPETSVSTPRPGGRGSDRRKVSLLAPGADPEGVLERIRSLIDDDQVSTARRLALEAAAQFPRHAKIRNVKRILNDGRSTPSSEGPEPGSREELEWLSDPPEMARGKWVALIGSELVGLADTLADLMESLSSRSLPRKPLVHHLE